MDREARQALLRDAQEQQRLEREKQVRERLKEMNPSYRPPEERKKEQQEDTEDKRQRFEMIRGMMSGASSFAQKAARGDASAVGDMAQSGLGMAAGAVGGPLASAGMDALVSGVRGMVDGLDALGKRLSEYNGALAQATAQAELQQLMGDIRRAAYAGNDLAELTAASSKLSQAAQDALLVLVRPVILPLTHLIELATSWLEQIGLGGAADLGGDAMAQAQREALNAFGGVNPDPAGAVPLGRPHLWFPGLFPVPPPLGGR